MFWGRPPHPRKLLLKVRPLQWPVMPQLFRNLFLPPPNFPLTFVHYFLRCWKLYLRASNGLHPQVEQTPGPSNGRPAPFPFRCLRLFALLNGIVTKTINDIGSKLSKAQTWWPVSDSVTTTGTSFHQCVYGWTINLTRSTIIIEWQQRWQNKHVRTRSMMILM